MQSKWCWLARQYRKGWRLGVCIGNDVPMYINFWFDSIKDIKLVVGKRNIVFVHLGKE